MAKRKRVRDRWVASTPFDANVMSRTAAYLAVNSGFFLLGQLRTILIDSYSGSVKFACRRLALMGYVELKIGCLSVDSSRQDRYPTVNFPDDPRGVADDRLAVVYAGTQKLIDEYWSGQLAERLVFRLRARRAVPVNERLLRKLIELHPEAITISQLKLVTEVSGSHPDLARRLEHLVAADWAVIERVERPIWASSMPYYHAAEWTVQLSSGGWLRAQRADSDDKPLKFPKPKKKLKKKEEPAAV